MLCPFKFKEFTDESRQQCSRDCAWRMDNGLWVDESPVSYACAIAVNASSCGAYKPTNVDRLSDER